MSAVKTTLTAICLALLTSAAFAFQEQKSGTSVPDAAQAPAEQAGKSAVFDPNTGAISTAATTEVRVPGFGKLGVLPKMDFGLELLYGAAEQKQPDSQQREEQRDDLTIRGSVKHKF